MPVFPPVPLAEWADTKETLHRFLQVVGKLRLANAPRRNHWWHIPFHLTGRGLTTRPMGFDPVFAVDLDLVDHRLEIAGRSYAKTSPVHHFWHTFDLAVTRFSDRRVAQPADVDPVTREAYSHEVISAGFWFGDDQVPEPAFYSYTAPEPAGLAEEPLRPAAARWIDSRGAHLALLPYEEVRTAADPRGVVLDFLDSAYVAGARRAGWDLAALRCPTAPEYR
ncbi:DUF5996 family protein [Geodermatophilus sp. SYSU D00079]